MTLGFDYLSARELSEEQRQHGWDPHTETGELIVCSAASKRLASSIRRVSRTDATLLIRGETGCGKEFVACQVVRHGSRAGGPLVVVDATILAPDILETYLFGEGVCSHRGTGALGGAFKRAQGGTLILKHVGALSAKVQEKLLKVLQNCRLAAENTSEEDNPVLVRLIATTCQSLELKVRRGQFREDLLYALTITSIDVPPLRERPEDIASFAEDCRVRLARKHELSVVGFSPACLECLQKRPWPGNVLELASAVEQAILQCKTGILEPEHFESNSSKEAGSAAESALEVVPENLDKAQKSIIFSVLERCEGNRTAAAKRLGISIRTLRNKLREYRLQDDDTSK